MKKLFFSSLLFVTTLLLSLRSQAQTEAAASNTPWLSTKGFWVVESNKQTPKEAIIYFYNNASILVHKEEIKDQRLKLTSTKTLLWLKAMLEGAVSGYENGTWASRRSVQKGTLQ